MSFKTTKFINFHNNTDLSVTIESWVDGSNEFQTKNINPGEKLVINSSVGEWHLTNYNLKNCKTTWNIGKFRSDPCASGNYSWMEYDDEFQCEYSKIPENISGLITLTQK
jgi:hypothetical protein